MRKVLILADDLTDVFHLRRKAIVPQRYAFFVID